MPFLQMGMSIAMMERENRNIAGEYEVSRYVSDDNKYLVTEYKNYRMQLENDAYYILTKQNYEYPETVAYMGDQMLQNIIRNYLNL